MKHVEKHVRRHQHQRCVWEQQRLRLITAVRQDHFRTSKPASSSQKQINVDSSRHENFEIDSSSSDTRKIRKLSLIKHAESFFSDNKRSQTISASFKVSQKPHRNTFLTTITEHGASSNEIKVISATHDDRRKRRKHRKMWTMKSPSAQNQTFRLLNLP